jgi:protein-tyrosine phosphatase
MFYTQRFQYPAFLIGILDWDFKLKKILFVCMGNICRSPTGEGIFKKCVADRSPTDAIFVDSAGTIGYHAGSPADQRMQQAALAKGYALESISRKVEPDDLLGFDLMIAMDRENLQDLERLRDESNLQPEDCAQIKLLSDYLEEDWPTDVPDPYYGGAGGFDYVVEMIETACPAIYNELSRQE